MKSPLDPRHKRRQKSVEELFKMGFHKQAVGNSTLNILKHKDFIDKNIQKAAPQFKIEKINKVDLAILRLALFELLIKKAEPSRVIIDEAIELAKEYGGETSPGFINGVLGNIIQNNHASSRI